MRTCLPAALLLKAIPFRICLTCGSCSGENTSRSIRLAGPLYRNQRTLSVVEVATNAGTVTFAVTEVSNGVYLFALPGIR